MPIDVQWDNIEKTVIRFDFSDPWNWDDLYNAIYDAGPMHEEVDNVVLWMYDVSMTNKVPSNALGTGKKLTQLMYENTSHDQVLIGANTVIRVLGTTFNSLYSRMYRVNIYFVETLEEGRAKARECLENAER